MAVERRKKKKTRGKYIHQGILASTRRQKEGNSDFKCPLNVPAEGAKKEKNSEVRVVQRGETSALIEPETAKGLRGVTWN